MRIGLVTAFYGEEYGGNEYYLSKYLAKQGHEVFIFVSEYTAPRYGCKKLFTGSKLDGVTVVRLKSFGVKKIGMVYLIGLKKALKDNKIDIVHVQEWFMPLVIGALDSKKLVVTSRLGNRKSANILFRIYCKLLWNIFLKNKVSKISSLTTESKNLFHELASPNKNVRIIPNGVDIHNFQYVDENANKKSDKLRILGVGRLDHEKGFDILLRALRDVDFDYELTLVGDGLQRHELEKYSEKNHLNTKFIKKCEHSKLSEIYSSHDFLVIPSRNEPFGLVLTEAMACGLPVIGSNIGGMKDVINSEVGLKFESENKEGLIKALNKMSDETFRESLAHNCRKYVVENYSWEKVSKKYFELYNS